MKVYIAVFTDINRGGRYNKVYATRQLAKRGTWKTDGIIDKDMKLVQVEVHDVEGFGEYKDPTFKEGWDGTLTNDPTDIFR